MMILLGTSNIGFAESKKVPDTIDVTAPVNVETECTFNDSILDQNKAGVIENDRVQMFDWSKYVTVSGLINADLAGSTRTPNAFFVPTNQGRYNSQWASAIGLNNATLFVDSDVNPYVYVHVALTYFGARSILHIYDHTDRRGFEHVPNPFPFRPVDFDEAFIRLRNFQQSPLFLQLGQFYVPFGDYERYPITESLPQQLEQLQHVALQGGYVSDSGFSASLYTFSGAHSPQRNINNFGSQVAYNYANDLSGFKVDLDYLFDMNDVNFIEPVAKTAFNPNPNRVPAMAADILWHVGAFDGRVNFISALERFSPNVMPKFRFPGSSGAIPKALDVGTGVTFLTYNYNSHIDLSYQHSWQAALAGIGFFVTGGGLPRDRVQGTYGINIMQNTRLAFQVRWDKDYSVASGGTGLSAVTGIARLSVGLA